MNYVISVYQTTHYYFCIRRLFDTCPPNQVYNFNGNSDLRRYSKRLYVLANKCPNPVLIRDLSNAGAPQQRHSFQLLLRQ